MGSLVSIIIPTYNSAKTLPKCLESIKKQTYKNTEVIVVDNESVDSTREIAESFGALIIPCRAGRSKARNVGAGMAEGEFIMSLDSDMELTPRVVEACLSAVKDDDKAGGVIVPERSVGDSFWVRVRGFEREFYANTEVESARFFRKKLVEEVKGFDEDVVCFEESTLPQKIENLGFNVKIRVCAEILHHEDNFSLRKWLQKKFYYGKTARLYELRYKNCASKQLNISNRLSLFLKDRRFYSKPLQAISVVALKGLEHFSISLGVLVSEV